MEREGFIFYRSFFEALCCLDKETRAECYDVILKYALDGIELETEGVVKAIFLSVKPQIDANNKRYLDGLKGAEYGKKGGRPRKNPIGDIKENPIGVLDENPKETPKEKDKDKEKDKEKVKDKEKDKDKYGKNVTLTLDEYQKLVTDFGYEDTQEAIQFLDDYIADKGYKSKSNYSAIRRWVIDAVRDRRKKKPPTGSIDDFFRQRIGNE